MQTAYFCLFHSEDIDEPDCIVLDCKEAICHKCLLNHVKKEIDSGNSIFFCPHKCKPETEISSFIIRKIVANTIYADKYEELLIKEGDKNKNNEEIKSHKEYPVKEKKIENPTTDDLKTMKKKKTIDDKESDDHSDEILKTKKIILGGLNNTSEKTPTTDFDKKNKSIKNVEKSECQRIENNIHVTNENTFTEEELKTKKIKKKKKEKEPKEKEKEPKEKEPVEEQNTNIPNDSAGYTKKRTLGESSLKKDEIKQKPNPPDQEIKIENQPKPQRIEEYMNPNQPKPQRIEEYIQPNRKEEGKNETNEKRIDSGVGAEGSQNFKNEKSHLKDQKLSHGKPCLGNKCSLI